MLTGKNIILFGAGIVGRRALNFFGADRVYCFADNKNGGQEFWGKRVISFKELLKIKDDYDIVLSVGTVNMPGLEEQCSNSGVRYHLFHNLVSHEMYKSIPEIRRFENKHKGERCFLVGNGPSLTAADLTKLYENKKISFGCNSICKIFDQTPWRPDYFVVQDRVVITASPEMYAETEAHYKFIPRIADIYSLDATKIEKIHSQGRGQVFYFNHIENYNFDKLPLFSPDVSKAVYTCGTVMYSMIQIAAYMGFSPIVLIGVDGNSVVPVERDKYLSEKRHFYKEDEDSIGMFDKGVLLYDSAISSLLISNAYKSAELYTRKHGIDIFNATRGGAVDAFRRVDLDSLFKV
jgi:hypothetical protein